MTWRFVGEEKGFLPIPGIPLECSDEDFEAALKELRGNDPEAIKKSGLYEHKSERQASSTPAKEEA